MKVLIVVDMQQDFVTGVLGSTYAQAIVPNVVAKIKKYLANGDNVIFTLDTHYKDTYLKTREGFYLPIPHCIIETEGHLLIPELGEIYREYSKSNLIDMTYKINQFGPPLYEIKDSYHPSETMNNVDEFEFIGVATNMCVISCVICSQNIYRNHKHTVDASCCASSDPILHEKALDVMENLHIEIINR